MVWRTAAIVFAACAVALLGLSRAASTPEAGSGRPVAVGTAHLADVVRDLTDGRVRVYNLIPGGMCPGHFDIRPSDIAKLAESEKLFIHPWQKGQANVSNAIAAADLEQGQVVIVDVPGNWMVPEVQARATRAVAEKLNSGGSGLPVERVDERIAKTRRAGAAAADRLKAANATGMKVLCNEMLVPFAKWAGFEVVASFGRQEDTSAADVAGTVDAARQSGVLLVIDNLQSGNTRLGATLAREAGARHVVLTNFPDSSDECSTWEQAFRHNIDLLVASVEDIRGSNG